MCDLHLVVLYIFDQNTIKMFVVVFCSFVVFCVVLVILGHDAFIQSRPWMLFLLSMTKHFPVQFILNPGHTEYELGVLMMGNIPNPNQAQTHDTCLTS